MKYWLDEEFIDDRHTIDLISIGIVSEDGRELYLQSSEFSPQRANKWVTENVLPHLKECPYVRSKGPIAGDRAKIVRSIASTVHLHKYGQCIPTMNEPERWQCPWRTRAWIAHEVKQFIDPEQYGKPEIWGLCSGYDYVALCQLFGTMMDLPSSFPHYIRDLQQVFDDRGISDEELPPQEEGLHNALSDARHIKKLWGYIVRNDCWQ